MASIKKLKKDLHFLVDEVIGTGIITRYTQPDKHAEIDKIIEDIDDFREEMLVKINKPALKGEQKKKAYFKRLYDELIEKVNVGFDQLGGISDYMQKDL